MKTILCPTDFSAASENAVHYAFELCKTFNAKIILYYSYYLPIPATDIPVLLPDPLTLHKEALSRLEELGVKMKKAHPGAKCNIELVATEGNPVIKIKAIQEKQEIDLIITGTKKAGGLKKALAGTNSARITVQASCPVITVPQDSHFRPFTKMVFATNYADGDFENIEKVIDFAKPFNAEVIMLHISEGNLDKTGEYAAIERFKFRVGEETGYSHLTFKLVESKDIEEGILLYLEEVKADLLAMTNRHRSFFDKIFERSLTKRIAFDTHTPLLAFHTSRQEVYLY